MSKISRRFIVAASVALAVAFAGFVLTGAVFCAATLRVPRILGVAPPGAAVITVSARDHAVLSAWWMRPVRSNRRCVVVLHGIGDSRAGSAGFAPMFLNDGYSVLLPDSRGHGASGGEFVTYGLLEKDDVMAWARWMKAAGCERLYGLGESLGASILIQAAAVQPVFSAIVAESAYADLREIAEYRFRQMSVPAPWVVASSAVFYARWFDGLDLDAVSPVRAIAHSSTPILLIHGLKDTRTPPSHSEQLARANPKDPLWLVANSGHTGAAGAAPEEFRRRVPGWFADHH